MLINLYIKKAVIALIKIYQKTLSFDHGLLKGFYPHGYCRFRPTCSDYAVKAIDKHGIIKGGIMAIRRLWRCNPWNRGGWDPVE